MGAATFKQTGHGRNARDAFFKAREDAAYEHGHGGYTGTLAEKNDFVEIRDVPGLGSADNEHAAKLIAHAHADRLLQDDDPRISDKWGPAGCIQISSNTWLFFGWASD